MGYSNDQVFLKRMYHEQLTNEDIQTIENIAIEYISEEIDRKLSYIEQRSNK